MCCTRDLACLCPGQGLRESKSTQLILKQIIFSGPTIFFFKLAHKPQNFWCQTVFPVLTLSGAFSLTSAASGGSRGGAQGARPPPPLFGVKKEEMTEGRKAGRASKPKPGPHLSSKSGSATGCLLAVHIICFPLYVFTRFVRVAHFSTRGTLVCHRLNISCVLQQ